MKNLTARQKEIIIASLNIISQKGLDYLTISTLSKSLNVTEGALYKHFKSKEEIISVVAEFTRQKFDEAINSIIKSPLTDMKKLKEIFIDRCRVISEKPELIMTMHSMSVFAGYQELSIIIIKSINTYKKTVMDVILECQAKKVIDPTIDPEHIFSIITGTLHYFITRWQKRNGEFDLVSEGEKLWKTVEGFITYKKSLFHK
jgi:TetR/AcrR family fatty acid metabolism transcriptional regulator